jgi:3-oxoadipate enol-lactonase
MKTIHINDIDVRYKIEGSGPWVTLSHSLTTDLSMWDELAVSLAPTFTVLRYDTRGHGGSSAPPGDYSFEQFVGDVLGLLDALGVARTHFVGLSMGGMIAQHLALHAPQRVDKLVIASSTSRIPPEAGPVWDQRIALAKAEGTAALVEATLGRWFTPPFHDTRSDIMARIAALIAATPVAGFIGSGAAIRRLDLTDSLVAITRPTLVIVGADDPGTPPAASEVIANAIPGARLEVIAAASHLCCIEQAPVFSRLVGDFLAG